MTEPRTAAGRALLAWFDSDARPLIEFSPHSGLGTILAIEAEARAAALDEARAALDGLRYGASGPDTMWLRCAAAIDALREGFGE